MATTVKVSKRNQIAVPSEARKKLGIKPGSKLRVQIEDARIVLEPERKSWVEELASIAPEIWEGIDPVEYVRELRDEWAHREH